MKIKWTLFFCSVVAALSLFPSFSLASSNTESYWISSASSDGINLQDGWSISTSCTMPGGDFCLVRSGNGDTNPFNTFFWKPFANVPNSNITVTFYSTSSNVGVKVACSSNNYDFSLLQGIQFGSFHKYTGTLSSYSGCIGQSSAGWQINDANSSTIDYIGDISFSYTGACCDDLVLDAPTPTPTPTATSTPTPLPTATPTVTPSPTATPIAINSPTPTATPSPYMVTLSDYANQDFLSGISGLLQNYELPIAIFFSLAVVTCLGMLARRYMR